MAAARHFAGWKGLPAGRAGFEGGREAAGVLARAAGTVFARIQRAGNFCGWRRAPRLGKTRGVGGRRRLDCGAVRPPVPGRILTGGDLERIMSLDDKRVAIQSVPLTDIAGALARTLPFADVNLKNLPRIE